MDIVIFIVNLNEEGLSVKERSHYNGAIIAGKDALRKAIELLPTEQQYIQQHAEGFAEWVVENGWRKFERTNVWHNSFDFEQPEKFTTSELYTKYINSLTT